MALAEVVKLQSAVPGVKVSGNTTVERIAHMKAMFSAAANVGSGSQVLTV